MQATAGDRRNLEWTHGDTLAAIIVVAVVGAGIASIVIASIPARQAVGDGLRSPASTAAVFVVIEVAFAGAGLLLVRRRRHNPIGWLLLAMAAVDAANRVAEYWSSTAVVAAPNVLPGGYGLAWLDAVTEGVVPVLFAIVVLLFPTGTLPSPRWRPVLVATAVSGALAAAVHGLRPGLLEGVAFKAVNPVGVDAARDVLDIVRLAVLAALGASVLACALSLGGRWLQGDDEERLQLKWLASAALLVVVVVPVVPLLPDPFTVLYALALAALPLSIAVAVLRWRLDAIDTLLRWAATAFLVATGLVVVFVAVLAATTMFGRAADPYLIAIGALVAIVAFEPLRRGARRLSDRLVLGPRARPYEVLAEFGVQIGIAAPGEELLDRMARVVADGTAARRAEVWGRDGDELHVAAAWPGTATPGSPARRPPGSGHPVPARLPLELPPSVHSYPIVHDGRLLGALAVELAPGARLRAREDELLADLAADAGLVLENARLISELRSSRERIVEAQDAERRRLERDLHDGAQQRLLALAIELRRARSHLDQLEPCEVAAVLDRTDESLQAAVDELRELARGIHPAILTAAGLGPALRSLADRSSVPVSVEADVPDRLPAPVEATAYFVVCEALTNAARHAGATTVTVVATEHNGRLDVRVTDDGRGGADPHAGTGLAGLADRVAAVGGRLEIDSPSGNGTTVTAVLPCG